MGRTWYFFLIFAESHDDLFLLPQKFHLYGKLLAKRYPGPRPIGNLVMARMVNSAAQFKNRAIGSPSTARHVFHIRVHEIERFARFDQHAAKQ